MYSTLRNLSNMFNLLELKPRIPSFKKGMFINIIMLSRAYHNFTVILRLKSNAPV